MTYTKIYNDIKKKYNIMRIELKISAGTILTYICKSTGNTITEIFEEVTKYGNYQMESCASYSAEEIIEMKIISGKVEQIKATDVGIADMLTPGYIKAKKCQSFIDKFYFMDATDIMHAEYNKAKRILKTTGYRILFGKLIKKS